MKSSYFKILAVALLVAVVAAIGVSQTVKRAHMRDDAMFGGARLRRTGSSADT